MNTPSASFNNETRASVQTTDRGDSLESLEEFESKEIFTPKP